MGNRYVRSLLWHLLIFLMSEVLLFLFLEWGSQDRSRTSAEATVMYMLLIMPVLYGVYFGMHMLFLLLTHRKKNYKFPLNPVSYVFLLDLLSLAFIGIIFDQDRALTKPIIAIAAGTSFFLLIEIYRSFYARSKVVI
jgi:hypothetical protein